jgi:hypothetical protein
VHAVPLPSGRRKSDAAPPGRGDVGMGEFERRVASKVVVRSAGSATTRSTAAGPLSEMVRWRPDPRWSLTSSVTAVES